MGAGRLRALPIHELPSARNVPSLSSKLLQDLGRRGDPLRSESWSRDDSSPAL